MHQFLDNELQGLRNLTMSNKDSQLNSNQSSKWQDNSNLSLSQLDHRHLPNNITVQPIDRKHQNIILE